MPARRESTSFMKNSSRMRGPRSAVVSHSCRTRKPASVIWKTCLRGALRLLLLVAGDQAVALQPLQRAVDLADVHRRPRNPEPGLEALLELVAVRGTGSQEGK